MHEPQVNAVHEVVKAAPAIVGTSYALAGLTLSEWAALLTCVYVILQIILLIPRFKKWLFKKD